MMVIDAYLAGELTGEARAAFERRVSAEPALRAELDEHASVDAALRSAFAAPAPALIEGAAPVAPAAPVAGVIGPSRRSWLGWGAVAASVAIVGVGALTYAFWPKDDPRAPKTPEQVYAKVLDGGFKPAVVCPNDPKEFSDLVEARLGSGLIPTLASGSGIALTGWGYANHWGTPLGPTTLVLLAERGPDKVVVFIDRLKNDRTLAEPKGSRHLYRKVTGNFVLYEISELPAPIVIPALDSN